jgi:hypothetical protein
LLFLVLVVLVHADAIAANEDIVFINTNHNNSIDKESSQDDMLLSVPLYIEDYGIIEMFLFETRDWFALDGTGHYYRSGEEAEYVILRVNVLNKTFTPKDYAAGNSVTVKYSDEYELKGFLYQIITSNYLDSYNSSNDISYTLLSTKSKAIEPYYYGHYLVGCKLPNAIANDKESSLQMIITLNGQEFIFNIR